MVVKLDFANSNFAPTYKAFDIYGSFMYIQYATDSGYGVIDKITLTDMYNTIAVPYTNESVVLTDSNAYAFT